MEADAIALAQEFLREVVFRSRASQSAATLFRPPPVPGAGACGLGEKAAVVLDLSERGREILALLFANNLGQDELARLRDVTADWVKKQDALDRRRNHFLKAFRARHGFDRRAYAPDVLAANEAGLAEVNGEEDEARRLAAERLLACAVRAS